MSKPKGSSSGWKARQERDPYVKMARRDGWRSRAVFKLEQILEKERLLRPDMICIDLGAAPGGWSQYVAEKLKGRGRILALDLLPMDALPQVEFIQGDFAEEAVLNDLLQRLGADRADLVLSDMAPNISGNKAVDQPRSIYLVELALDLAGKVLGKKGSFVCKLFQGEGTDAVVADARRAFERVKIVKPAASRPGSSEIYLVARNYRL
ncbi:MAG: 23S rRNA methyltransferase [Gammaproteobacteria bacterium]|nr:23S rRNA methyltransferase [Gammaproteobacteria bacterium]MDH4316392.1 23S rRNA methyltransferase [Gammaproteobacteria bacterium]MDH5213740.1 23S rRNA methyltransferase [Gammaproteobacteria bacterium]